MANPVTEALERALDNLGPNGENWVQGSIDAFMYPKCCIATALARAANPVGNIELKGTHVLALELLRISAGCGMIVFWNDTPGRTFAEVKEVYLRKLDLCPGRKQ